MDIARRVTAATPAAAGVARLTVVTPQRGRGAMPTSEEMNVLMRAVAVDGDRQAFAVLFKHFAPRVATYLVRGGTPAASAEELAQEAMVLLWRKAASFDPARAGVSTWIFTIARNLRIDRHRRAGRAGPDGGDAGVAIEPDEHADPAASPEERLGELQRERAVRAALRQLSPDQARVLQLSFFAETPHAEIARELCIPLGTVKSRIRRAMQNLRRLIDA
ncbi:MAG: sigma-70 family RNA polymerase sigma factor [Caldimonas sp.]